MFALSKIFKNFLFLYLKKFSNNIHSEKITLSFFQIWRVIRLKFFLKSYKTYFITECVVNVIEKVQIFFLYRFTKRKAFVTISQNCWTILSLSKNFFRHEILFFSSKLLSNGLSNRKNGLIFQSPQKLLQKVTVPFWTSLILNIIWNKFFFR